MFAASIVNVARMRTWFLLSTLFATTACGSGSPSDGETLDASLSDADIAALLDADLGDANIAALLDASRDGALIDAEMIDAEMTDGAQDMVVVPQEDAGDAFMSTPDMLVADAGDAFVPTPDMFVRDAEPVVADAAMDAATDGTVVLIDMNVADAPPDAEESFDAGEAFDADEADGTVIVLQDAALPDAPLPDAPLPDAPLPDAALPDAALPDAPPVTCTANNPAFGTVNSSVTPVTIDEGSSATYACQSGYALTGTAPTCLGTGSLSGAEPTCVAITCTAHAPVNGTVNTSTTNVSLAYGESATYACNIGTLLSGSAPTCGGTSNPGTLSGAEPTCALGAITSMATGASHTCAINSADGTIWCWGLNLNNQVSRRVGDLRTYRPTVVADSSNTPVTGFTQVTAGDTHSCALKSDGTVWCWGSGLTGLLGYGSTSSRAYPVQVMVDGSTTLANVTQIDAGNNHTCALQVSGTDRRVWCWGNGANGRLGNGGTSNASYAVKVQSGAMGNPDLSDVAQVVAGATHTCARMTNGHVTCWGQKNSGRLGGGAGTGNQTRALAVLTDASTELSGVSTITVGGASTCAVLSSGTMYCWGSNNSQCIQPYHTGGAFVYATEVRQSDEETPLSTEISNANIGETHTCITYGDDDNVRCWGSYDLAQSGDETPSVHDIAFTDASPLQDVSVLSLGAKHSCAVASGRAYCWGNNSNGQLQNARTATPYDAMLLDITESASSAAAGDTTSCAVKSGRIDCWGQSTYGERGNGFQEQLDGSAVTQVLSAPSTILSNVQRVVSAGTTFCAIVASDRKVMCWGYNGTSGITATNSIDDAVNYATQVRTAADDLQDISVLSGGTHRFCAVRETDQTVWCWGENGNGALGVGDTSEVPRARQVRTTIAELSDIVDVSIGSQHGCAVTSGGALYCWGNNDYGQLGDGSTTSSMFAIQALDGASPMSNVRQVSVGETNTCVLKTNDSVWCWGNNAFGQLGDGSTTSSFVPIAVATTTGTLQDVAYIDASDNYGCALMNDGRVQCWGYEPGTGRVGHGTYGGEYVADYVSDGLSDLSNVQELYVGASRVFAATDENYLFGWGEASAPSLALGYKPYFSRPLEVLAH